MKRIVLVVFSAALLFAACSKDDQQAAATQQGSEYVDANGHPIFYAQVGRASKVAMSTSTQQCFTADDKVLFIDNSCSPIQKAIYKVDASGSTKVSGSSTLYSKAKLVYKSGDELYLGYDHYAVIPSNATVSELGDILVDQKIKQKAAAGTQDTGGCIHFARSSSESITFNTLSSMPWPL